MYIPLLYCLVEDTLDSILGGSDDEAEEDAVISQVLDEIGIEVTGKVNQHLKVVHLIVLATVLEQDLRVP